MRKNPESPEWSSPHDPIKLKTGLPVASLSFIQPVYSFIVRLECRSNARESFAIPGKVLQNLKLCQKFGDSRKSFDNPEKVSISNIL